jgi:hypothetical protein
VLDAVSIYRRRDMGGRLYALELLDGATIKPLLDQSGRRPESPMPAFQQVLKGVPAVNYTTDELLYYPQNVRADRAYGFSRVEMVITTVETAIERMKSQKAFFTNGNLPEGFFAGATGWTPDQLAKTELYWNALMTASTEARRRIPFMPDGLKWEEVKAPPLQNEFDEWLARILCFVFSTAPTPFMKQQGLGHGSAGTEHQAAEAAGLANIMGYVRRVMNRVLIEDFRRPDLEFTWIEDREFDPDKKDQIESRQLRDGRLTLNEARDRIGEEPIDGGDVPIIYLPTGPVRVDVATAEPVEPDPPQIPPQAGGIGAPANEPAAGGQNQPVPGGLAKAAPKKLERKLAAILKKFLAAKGKEIGKQLGAELGLAKAEGGDDDASRIDKALGTLDWDWTSLSSSVQPVLTGIATATGKQALADLSLFSPAVTKQMTERASDYAKSRAAELVGRRFEDGELVENEGWSIPEATRDMVRSAVTAAIEQGASNDELATAVAESDAFSEARAINIARTETAIADTQGSVAGWKASGLVAGKQWMASEGCLRSLPRTRRRDRRDRRGFRRRRSAPLTRNVSAHSIPSSPRTCRNPAMTKPTRAEARLFPQEKPMNGLALFIPLTKADAAQRLVYGRFDETPDRAGEVFDYATSKPLIEAWSSDIAKASGRQELRQRPRPARQERRRQAGRHRVRRSGQGGRLLRQDRRRCRLAEGRGGRLHRLQPGREVRQALERWRTDPLHRRRSRAVDRRRAVQSRRHLHDDQGRRHRGGPRVRPRQGL